MENIIIRKVKKEDLLEISKISVEGCKITYKGIIDDKYLDSLKIEDKYKKMLKNYNENGLFIVAKINNEVVGFCSYTIDNRFSKDCIDIDCELCSIYVKKDLKHQGIGKSLFNYVIQEQKRNNNTNMIIWCLKENNNAKKFYEKMGGIVYGENQVELGGKNYIEVGYKFELCKL